MKRWTSNVSFFGMALILTILFCGSFGGATETSIQEIVSNKDSYEGQVVSVSGAVSSLKFKKALGGKDYTTFSIVGEPGGLINVFIWGRLNLRAGQKVQAKGVYRKLRIVGSRTYYNQIEASEVK